LIQFELASHSMRTGASIAVRLKSRYRSSPAGRRSKKDAYCRQF